MTQRKTDQQNDFSEIDYEQAFQELEQLVEKLEQQQHSLEDTVATFERGINLADHCRTLLDNAERRVTKLLPDGNETEFE